MKIEVSVQQPDFMSQFTQLCRQSEETDLHGCVAAFSKKTLDHSEFIWSKSRGSYGILGVCIEIRWYFFFTLPAYNSHPAAIMSYQLSSSFEMFEGKMLHWSMPEDLSQKDPGQGIGMSISRQIREEKHSGLSPLPHTFLPSVFGEFTGAHSPRCT